MLGLVIMSIALSMTIGAAIAQSFHKDGVTTALRIQLMITTMLGAKMKAQKSLPIWRLWTPKSNFKVLPGLTQQ